MKEMFYSMWCPIIFSLMVMAWGIYWSVPHGKKSKEINFEKIGTYIGIIGLLFMFWSFWRDLHVSQADMRERIARLETKVEILIDHKMVEERSRK